MRKKARGKKGQATKRGAKTSVTRKARTTAKGTKGGSRRPAKAAGAARAVARAVSPAAGPADVGTYTPSAIEGIGWPPFRYSRQ